MVRTVANQAFLFPGVLSFLLHQGALLATAIKVGRKQMVNQIDLYNVSYPLNPDYFF